MAVIAPTGQLKILSGVPLDDTYTDTILFTSAGAQTAYFNGKSKFTLPAISYQRVNSQIAEPRKAGTVRVNIEADNLYDCNYVMFQNTSFGTKWFYAFIKQVNYINEHNSEIVYEIDAFQTWRLSCKIGECFVEREHSPTDEYFENLVPEPLSVNYYDCIKEQINKDAYGSRFLTIVSTENIDNLFDEPGVKDGIYSGCYYKSVPLDQYSQVNAIIKSAEDKSKSDAIVGVFIGCLQVNDGMTTEGEPFVSEIPTRNLEFKGYTAKHKKLASYPFRFIRIRTVLGQSVDLYPQLINVDGNLTGVLYNCNSTLPQMALVPNYNNRWPDWEKAVIFDEIVQCGWKSDVFANWLGQSFSANVVGSAITGAVAGSALPGFGTAAGAIAGAAIGIMKTTANQAGAGLSNYVKPDVEHGNPMTSSIAYSTNSIGFELLEYAPNAECAKQIDDFFTMYGYAMNKVKIPNETQPSPYNSKFNYVKTNGVKITGSIPVDAMETIKSIYDGGVRLWHGDIT